MNLLEQVFATLPIPLQQAACHFEGWRIATHRYGGRFSQLLAEVEGREQMSAADLYAWRDQRLKRFWQDAALKAKFYEPFRDAGIESLGSLAQLPVVNKAIVQQQPERFYSSTIPDRNRHWAHTSGTTGAGLRFPITRSAHQEQWATWWRYRRWHGIRLDTWCGYFGGRMIVPLEQPQPPYWRVNGPGRQILFSGSHMREDRLPAYVEELRRRRPPWLHGYPSLLSLLAEYLTARGIDLGYRIQWVTTGAENLALHQARQMERAFGVRPRQHYGMAEGVANISECEQGRLHVDEDFSAVEFLPAGEPGRFRVVGTNFANPAFPLVRYEIGDFVDLDERRCPCGRAGRVVRQIDGRAEDYLQLPDGTRLGRLDHIFKDAIHVREAQIWQAQPTSMKLRIVRGPGYGAEDEQRLLAETRRRVGAQIEIEVEYLNSLPRTGTGKLRLVVNERPPARVGIPA